jgi:hypothetical protein
LLLLPEAVDDYVGPDNPVRFIDALVDGLDFAAASFIHVETLRLLPHRAEGRMTMTQITNLEELFAKAAWGWTYSPRLQ